MKPKHLSIHRSLQYDDIVFAIRSDGRVVRKIGPQRKWELTSIPVSYVEALPKVESTVGP